MVKSHLSVVVVAVAVLFSAPTLSARQASPAQLDKLRSAANAGDVKAMIELGRIYLRGEGVPRDFGQASTWYTKAADTGSAEAMFRLGALWSNAGNTPEHQKQKVSWYRKAAELGHGDAMFSLATCYWAGKGLEQDYVEAYKWLDVSAAFLTGEAQKRSLTSRDSLGGAKVMTPAMVADAKQRSRDWQVAFEAKESAGKR